MIIIQQQTQTTSLFLLPHCESSNLFEIYILFYILFILSYEMFFVNNDMSNNYFYIFLYATIYNKIFKCHHMLSSFRASVP